MTRPRRRTTLAREVAAALDDEPALEDVDPTYLDPHDDEPEMRWRFHELRLGELADAP